VFRNFHIYLQNYMLSQHTTPLTSLMYHTYVTINLNSTNVTVQLQMWLHSCLASIYQFQNLRTLVIKEVFSGIFGCTM
jgi:hypothetical protein